VDPDPNDGEIIAAARVDIDAFKRALLNTRGERVELRVVGEPEADWDVYVVDEWGAWYAPEPGTEPALLYQQNTQRDALVAAVTLNVFNNNAARVRMANIAQAVNVLQALVLTRGAEMMVTPTYHVFEMYRVHQDATLVPAAVLCDEYTFAGRSIPVLSASASRTPEGQIHLSLCNLHPSQAARVRCELGALRPATVHGRVLTADSMQAHNTFEAPTTVTPAPMDACRLRGGTLEADLPAKSVAVLELA